MRCLVFVKFLPGGSLAPEEFFARINAQWSWLEDMRDSNPGKAIFETGAHTQYPRSAICITDYDSIEQLSIDLSIMPGAGISNIEVLPLSEEVEPKHSYRGFLMSGFHERSIE
jgi:hypothetical protein